ncbi:MAG TPA: hypothetical protein VFW93_09375 [Aquabacterium sp.]|uniref:hypothetical protein n=1 Tax=Aquabacterium sp. TaxID=1872578 RepID=UPI002E360427|nr:hypothetical protein [Aquabacterium sp.]HEX5356419.1 hypothetical protein [Aquabacterium sp.]
MVSTSIRSGLHVASVAIGVVAASFSTQAAAINVTLPTTNIQANSQYTFNSDTQDLMQNMGISVRALGNSKQTTPGLWSFSMPVTDVSLSMSLLPLNISPTAGHASGSALGIYSEEGGLQLANFALDFKRNVLSADFISKAGTTRNFDVYNFNVEQGLHVSTSGGLSMQMSLTQMKLTTGAQSAFMQALVLPDYAIDVLGQLDFGRLDIKISPALRFNVSDKPYTATMAAPVPEIPSVGMLALGMFGIAIATRRKLNA